jgi:membrane associated rhomboid family serine protease
MAYFEQQYKRRISFAQASNALVMLVAVHLLIFVMLYFVKALFYLKAEPGMVDQVFATKVLNYFTLPANMGALASRPWVVLTHMFTDVSVWNIIGNMLWLWFFGYVLQDLTGNRKIIPVFIYGSLVGALAFILAVNFIPSLKTYLPGATLTGAGAGVLAIAVAATTIAPGYRILPMLSGGIPLWIITAVYIIIKIATISSGNLAMPVMYMAAAATGFFFVFSYRRGFDWGNWMNNFADWINNLFNPDKPKKGKEIKTELFYKSGTASPYKKTPNVTEQRINEILDKIHEHGFHSLTIEEKELLKRASKDGL